MRLRIVAACAGVLAWATSAFAQAPPSRFGITDNSFLVEEAFNQEAGIFQNIFVVARGRDGVWAAAFTQEWPLGGQRHQLSVTFPFSATTRTFTAGDVLINYRLQVWSGEGGLPAWSPRVSAVIATSAERRPAAFAGSGWQINLPFSKEAGPIFLHGNAGATWLEEPPALGGGWRSVPFAAASVIWGARPLFNPMFEVFAEWPDAESRHHEAVVTMLPGLRAGWNQGDRQWVLGVGVPVTRGARDDVGVLVYASFELPFRRK